MLILQKEKIQELTTKIKTGDRFGFEEVEQYTKELGGLIKTDPRLSDELEHDLLELLLKLLQHEQNPKLQSHVAIILQLVVAYSSNWKLVIDNITHSTIVNLLHSELSAVRVQALWLLHTIALKFSSCPESKVILEGALECLTSIITDHYPVDEESSVDEFCIGGRTLAVACQLNPELSCDKLKLVLPALMKLIEHESWEINPSGCIGLVYLCEGRKEMVVEKEYFEPLIKRLFRLSGCGSHVEVISGLAALGSIVRWGSDGDIEVVIEVDEQFRLEHLLGKKVEYFVKNVCWIISNLCARKEKHIKAIIDSELIDPLVRVIENYESLDVKKEAAWAISNVIYGVGPDQIKYLRDKCVKPLWNLLKIFSDNQEMVSLCLEGLVRLEGMKVTCNDQPIDSVEWFKVFRKYLARQQTEQSQLAEDIEALTKLKKLRRSDIVEIPDGNIVFRLTCTFQDDSHHVWQINHEMAYPMEVDMPR